MVFFHVNCLKGAWELLASNSDCLVAKHAVRTQTIVRCSNFARRSKTSLAHSGFPMATPMVQPSISLVLQAILFPKRVHGAVNMGGGG